MNRTTFGFPFGVSDSGRIEASGGDDAIRGKILQVLFTSPGERVNQPDFGCGLFKLVFEPNNPILAATTEFTVGQALARWLSDEIMVSGVSVEADEGEARIEVEYTKKQDLARQVVRIRYQ